MSIPHVMCRFRCFIVAYNLLTQYLRAVRSRAKECFSVYSQRTTVILKRYVYQDFRLGEVL